MDFRIDRRALKVITFAEDRRTNRSLTYGAAGLHPSAWPPSSSCGGSSLDLAPDFDEFCALLTARLDRYAAPCVNVVLIANRTAVPGARSAPKNTGNQPRVFWEIDTKPLTG